MTDPYKVLGVSPNASDDEIKWACKIACADEFVQQFPDGYETMIDQGGVNVSELNDNLESVNNPGIFFAGELVDIDGKCGGYNLQWAWSSGVVAAKSVFDYCNRQE